MFCSLFNNDNFLNPLFLVWLSVSGYGLDNCCIAVLPAYRKVYPPDNNNNNNNNNSLNILSVYYSKEIPLMNITLPRVRDIRVEAFIAGRLRAASCCTLVEHSKELGRCGNCILKE
jgi:hypothetical protein